MGAAGVLMTMRKALDQRVGRYWRCRAVARASAAAWNHSARHLIQRKGDGRAAGSALETLNAREVLPRRRESVAGRAESNFTRVTVGDVTRRAIGHLPSLKLLRQFLTAHSVEVAAQPGSNRVGLCEPDHVVTDTRPRRARAHTTI